VGAGYGKQREFWGGAVFKGLRGHRIKYSVEVKDSAVHLYEAGALILNGIGNAH